jgi:UDP-N-acetylmuramoylalanine--D-glutamate ligase
MMKDWSSQRVLIIGAARQGTALARYLAFHGAHVVINDQRSADDLQDVQLYLSDLPIRWVLGEHPLSLLEKIDLICPSGGVPLTLPMIIEAQKRGIPLSNDSQVFLESAPCKVIGITGSAGKTTTTSLVGRIARGTNKQVVDSPYSSRVWVGGNIGNPLISDLDDIQDTDLVVMELSSFQLEIMTRSPQVASILNISPNHLDRHGTMTAYIAAKARILDFQQEDDIAVLGSDDPEAWKFERSVKGKLISFGFRRSPEGQVGCFLDGDQIVLWDGDTAQILFERETIHLRGDHNLANVLAACAIAYAAGIPIENMRTGVDQFTGVPHRMEFIRSWGGADWYNDSIATAPERTIAAIHSFDEPLVLLLGGRDKDLPWDELATLVNERVKHVILFGEAAELIRKAIDLHKGTSIRSVTHRRDLKQAVHAAAELVKPGDVVLLSPGGTSFDAFRDFAERGEQYRVWVNELP